MIAEIQTGNLNGNPVWSLPVEALPTPENGWLLRPFQIVSLLEMLRFYAGPFYSTIRMLSGYQEDLRTGISVKGKDAHLTQEELELLRDTIKYIDDDCEKIGLKRVLERLAHLRNRFLNLDLTTFKESIELTLGELQWEVEDAANCMAKDLFERQFFYMPPHFAKYHYNSLSVFSQRELYGKEVIANFPNAIEEMRAAGNCYATDSYTACVFHLMRAAEYGLRAVFKRFRIKYSKKPKVPVEFLQWGDIISAIQDKIDEKEKTKKTKRRDEDIEFLRGVVAQFKYFKNKWRNNVMHSRESYELEDATKTMRQVGDFMEHLATRVKE